VKNYNVYQILGHHKLFNYLWCIVHYIFITCDVILRQTRQCLYNFCEVKGSVKPNILAPKNECIIKLDNNKEKPND